MGEACFPFIPFTARNRVALPSPAGDHEGHPYGAPGLLPLFMVSVVAYWRCKRIYPFPHGPRMYTNLVRRLGDGYGGRSNRLLTACYLYFLYSWDDLGSEDVERFQVVDVGHTEDGLVDALGCEACEMLDGGSRGH